MASVVLLQKLWHDRSQNYMQILKKYLHKLSGHALKIGLYSALLIYWVTILVASFSLSN